MVKLKSMDFLFVLYLYFLSYVLDLNYTAIFHQPLCFIVENFLEMFLGLVMIMLLAQSSLTVLPWFRFYCGIVDFGVLVNRFGYSVLTC